MLFKIMNMWPQVLLAWMEMDPGMWTKNMEKAHLVLILTVLFISSAFGPQFPYL